ncbi:Transcription initiation factor TFIID subunit 2 [Goodea atripinnis]|uniref:Transcription initiation factor TFIID subunit 2 n=2 Tax=Goodeidae TaxID=28758 RepID=A0ABV0N9S4_9TELE
MFLGALRAQFSSPNSSRWFTSVRGLFCVIRQMSLCFFPCRADEWVLKGISGYIYGLYLKKTFGVNEYRHWIKEELDRIVEYELKMGGVLLHPTFSGGKEKDKYGPY